MRLRMMLLALAVAAGGCGGGDDEEESSGESNGESNGEETPPEETPPPVMAQVCNAYQHTCVMRASGEVYCAGRNLDGELGDGTAQTRWTWVPVVGVSGATQLACGAEHTCAITRSGVSCWGHNEAGQLGGGNTNVAHQAVQVEGLTDATQLALGHGFSCALRAGGTVSCWGDGADGRLGNGTTDGSPTPVAVTGLTDVAEITAGRGHACARKNDGTVMCWGSGSSGQLGLGGERGSSSNAPVLAQGLTGATHIAAGGNHTCAIVGEAVHCWGQNRYGQSGAGEENVMAPTAVAGLTGATELQLAESRTCALVAGGAVHCWGYNNYTAELLGVGSTEEKVTTPTAVSGLTGLLRFDTSATGTSATACGLNESNQLWCWGVAGNGRLGNGEPNSLHTPSVVVPDVNALTAPASTLDTFAAVAEGLPARTSFEVGSHTVCGVREGQVYCFGPGSDGRLGHGSTRANPAASATAVAGITDAVEVSTGLTRTCALRRNGTVACWGQLTSRVESSLPVAVEGITDARAIDVGGSASAMALCVVHAADGGVSCVGERLGTSQASELTAQRIEGLTGVAEVNVGTDSACARLEDGHVHCWGSGSYGQLGNGATDRSATPVEVSGITDATGVGGGSYNNCALRRGGTVSCWGSGDDGQLANGQTGREANSPSPVAVRGLRGVASIGKMGDSMCVALENGGGMCWGANDFGQTGHGDAETDDVTTPWEYVRTDDAVAAMGNLVTMGCGWNFCCGLHANGGVSCAGSTPLGGSSGFFGLANVRSTTPVAAEGITYPVVSEAAAAE